MYLAYIVIHLGDIWPLDTLHPISLLLWWGGPRSWGWPSSLCGIVTGMLRSMRAGGGWRHILGVVYWRMWREFWSVARSRAPRDRRAASCGHWNLEETFHRLVRASIVCFIFKAANRQCFRCFRDDADYLCVKALARFGSLLNLLFKPAFIS